MKYIISILIILFASYADIFLFRIGILPVEPSDFLIPFFLVICAITYSVKDIFDLIRSHSFKFFVAILILSILYAVISPATSDTIVRKIVLNIFTLLFYVFVTHFFRTESKKLVFLVLLFAFLSLAGSVLYDFFIGLPKYNTKLAEAVRKGGFGENPNQAASGIKFLALGVLIYLRKAKFNRIIFIVIMVVSVFLTFSRSGIFSIIVLLILGTANNWSPKFEFTTLELFKNFFKMAFLFSVLYLGLVFFAGFIKENYPSFTRGSAGQRIDLLLGKNEKGVISEEVVSGGREDLLFKYFNLFKQNPIGYGTGFASDKRFNSLNSHNYYLNIGVEMGILALLLYLIYIFHSIFISIRDDQFYYLTFIILLIFEGFFSHNIFYERAILISVAFFDSLIYSSSIKYKFKNEIIKI